MDEFPTSLPEVLNPITAEELFRAREERRKRLAALPLTEKVRLMEKLQAAGRELREARGKMMRR